MSEPLVLREWRKFATKVLDPAAGPVQRAEMRMAWVTGARVVLAHLGRAPNANLPRRRVGQILEESKAAMDAEGRLCEERAKGGVK